MKFADLKFNEHPNGDGVQAVARFENGYGASVICGEFSYGGKDGLYEVAILKGKNLCYDTPISDDVIGHCTPDDVERILHEIESLDAPQ